jgi:hypothetical protein
MPLPYRTRKTAELQEAHRVNDRKSLPRRGPRRDGEVREVGFDEDCED